MNREPGKEIQNREQCTENGKEKIGNGEERAGNRETGKRK